MVRSRALRGVSNHEASGEATIIRVNLKALQNFTADMGFASFEFGAQILDDHGPAMAIFLGLLRKPRSYPA